MGTVGPLLSAVMRDDVAEVRRLVKDRRALNERDPLFQRTPLMAAVLSFSHQESDIVQALLDAGSDPNSTDAKGETALLFAISARRVEDVRLLLRAGARVDPVNREGLRAIDAAATRDRTGEMTRLLLDAGADPRLPSSRGLSAWDLLSKNAAEGYEAPAYAIVRAWIAARGE